MNRPTTLARLLLCLAPAFLAACATAPGPRPAAPPSPAAVEAPARPPRVAVVLGGGGVRGFAEIGVLHVLEQERIPVDIVVGTSVGSLVGTFYADSGRVFDAEFLAAGIEERDLFDYSAMAVFSGGLIKGERLEDYVRSRLRHHLIEKMEVKYAAVAVDVTTGKTTVFDRGPVAPAVHASCAIPGVFVPVEIDGATYVDGGVTDPLPADVARGMGADVVIAVAIPPAVPRARPKNPLEVAFHAVTLMTAEIGRLRAREADVVVEPNLGVVGFRDFDRRREMIEAGEAAARAALPAIRAAIAARSR